MSPSRMLCAEKGLLVGATQHIGVDMGLLAHLVQPANSVLCEYQLLQMAILVQAGSVRAKGE